MRRAKVLNNERGFIKFILVILILSCMIYVGIKLGIPYYKYSAFKTDAKEIARISIAVTPARTHAQVYERAQELNIPLTDEDIQVKKTGTGVRIEAAWSETVDFIGMYQYTFNFTFAVEG